MSGAANDRSGLSPSARALLHAARDADGPTARDRERVRRALAVALAAGAGTAGATVSAATGAQALAGTASGASTGAVGGAAIGSGAAVGTGAAIGGTAIGGGTATGLAGAATVGLFTKVAIAMVAIGVGTTAIMTVNHYASTDTSSAASVSATFDTTEPAGEAHETTVAPHEARETAVAPADLEPSVQLVPPADVADETVPIAAPVGTPPRAIEARPHASSTARRARVAPVQPTAEPESTQSTLVAEMIALHDAIRHSATPAQRLESVDVHEARFPAGELVGERERARRSAVHDLCAQGSDAVAGYLASHPSGPSASLLRASCAHVTP